MDPDVSYEDDERVALCEQLQQLENEKEQIINREDLLGDEKIREHFQVHEVIMSHEVMTGLPKMLHLVQKLSMK